MTRYATLGVPGKRRSQNVTEGVSGMQPAELSDFELLGDTMQSKGNGRCLKETTR